MSEEEGKKGVLATKLAERMSSMQAIDVHVEADNPAWRGPLACQASNSFGNWKFVAPGTVIVQTSASPLQITCKAPSVLRRMQLPPHRTPVIRRVRTPPQEPSSALAQRWLWGCSGATGHGAGVRCRVGRGQCIQGSRAGGVGGRLESERRGRVSKSYRDPYQMHIIARLNPEQCIQSDAGGSTPYFLLFP